MRRIRIAVRVLLVIALFGLPAGVQAQGAGDGLVAEGYFDEGSRGVLGMIEVSSSHYFTTPEGADEK